ncbi:MAG: oxygenase MpaB family protein [Candidatus Limnocylindrales bacterium]
MDAPRADDLLGFYGPDSMMWRINREAVLLGAGPTALLLQIAHPLVAEGVGHHSTFAQDPFKRLHGTITTTMDLVFGDGAAAERAVRKLNGIHAGIRGAVADEEARHVAETYRALDPALLLWVQTTLIVTSVRAYRRWVGPLTRTELDQFWQEARLVGVRLGIPLTLSPADWSALTEYWRRMLAASGPIHVTPTARALAPMIMRPPISLVPGAAIDLLALPGLSLLPKRLRQEFGIGWDSGRELLAQVMGFGIRTWVRAAPRGLRAMPQAREAERRTRLVRSA